ncbi:MAG: lysozyme inhibitor LprI family protein [Paracoccaceae bacterium]
MMALRILAAIALLAAPAAGQEATQAALVEQIDTCIGAVGEPADHADLCLGIHAQPCMEEETNASTQGMVGCIQAEAGAWDAILNREYKNLLPRLDEEQTDAIRRAQRAWIAFRDADCAFPHVLIRGTLAQPWGADCYMQHTARRAMTLRGLIEYTEN